ncbi:MAG: hypothetical protein U0M42_05295 [Acutalibacteraceae bacterium]|nr:hypothetical protein [Acutalibacteraceae bacterium]
MSLVTDIKYVKEPTNLQCGQAVLAMLTGLSVEEIISQCGTDRETTLKQMKSVMKANGVSFDENRKEVQSKEDLPQIAILSLETPRCWHWSLFFKGIFYDPEHGILSDFPHCNRKYYWEIKRSG